jgi:hypothetical protein
LPDGAVVLVTWEPWQFDLGQAALPRQAIHDLHLLGISRGGTKQPLAERVRLLEVAGIDEGIERERSITNPAIPVVPVAGTTDPLR